MTVRIHILKGISSHTSYVSPETKVCQLWKESLLDSNPFGWCLAKMFRVQEVSCPRPMGLPLFSGQKPGWIIAGDKRGKKKVKKLIWFLLESSLACMAYKKVSLFCNTEVNILIVAVRKKQFSVESIKHASCPRYWVFLHKSQVSELHCNNIAYRMAHSKTRECNITQ